MDVVRRNHAHREMLFLLLFGLQSLRPRRAELLQSLALFADDRRCQVKEVGDFHEFSVGELAWRCMSCRILDETLAQWKWNGRRVEASRSWPNCAPILIDCHLLETRWRNLLRLWSISSCLKIRLGFTQIQNTKFI